MIRSRFAVLMDRDTSDCPADHMGHDDDSVVFKSREYEINTVMAEHFTDINSRCFFQNLASSSQFTYLGNLLSFLICTK